MYIHQKVQTCVSNNTTTYNDDICAKSLAISSKFKTLQKE